MVFARPPLDERASLSTARRLSDDAEYAPYLLPSGPFRARGVSVPDRELLRRVQRVQVTREFTASDELSQSARRRRAGWTLERHRAGFSVLSRRWEGGGAGATPVLATVATGTLPCAVEQLARLLRAPGESEFNALMRGAFKSRFIYGSLVHFVGNSSRAGGARSLLPSSDADAQLAVRTTSFVHSKLASLFPVRGGSARDLQRQESDDTSSTTATRDDDDDAAGRNDQFCYAEYFVPTPRGFVIRYCSLPDQELRAGVAPRARVAQLHPFTGWLVAERVGGARSPHPSSPRQPPRVRLTFRATYHGRHAGCCSAKRAAQWMTRVATAVSRLGDVVRATFRARGGSTSTTARRSTSGVNKAPRTHGGGHGVTANGGGGHRNWHCIACTKSLFSVFKKTWRRCDLCAYSVCADSCCSLDHVAIYNRYVAPLLVCARCQECMDDPPSRPSSAVSPSTAGMWALTHMHAGRASMDAMGRRRAMSDPPFIPTLELTSSGEDHSSSN